MATHNVCLHAGIKLKYIPDISQSKHLNHCSRETHKGQLANSADPDQTQQNAAFDQGLHCLQTV